MAQEQSVQGAAEKISGLLNPKQDNQVPEKKEAAPQSNLKRSNRNLQKRVNQSLKKLPKK